MCVFGDSFIDGPLLVFETVIVAEVVDDGDSEAVEFLVVGPRVSPVMLDFPLARQFFVRIFRRFREVFPLLEKIFYSFFLYKSQKMWIREDPTGGGCTILNSSTYRSIVKRKFVKNTKKWQKILRYFFFFKFLFFAIQRPFVPYCRTFNKKNKI